MASIGSMRMATLQGRHRKERVCLREGKSKLEEKKDWKEQDNEYSNCREWHNGSPTNM